MMPGKEGSQELFNQNILIILADLTRRIEALEAKRKERKRFGITPLKEGKPRT